MIKKEAFVAQKVSSADERIIERLDAIITLLTHPQVEVTQGVPVARRSKRSDRGQITHTTYEAINNLPVGGEVNISEEVQRLNMTLGMLRKRLYAYMYFQRNGKGRDVTYEAIGRGHGYFIRRTA